MCDCVCLACFGACAAAIFIIGIYFFFGIIFTTLAIRAKNAINSYDAILQHSANQFSEGNLYLNLCITIGVLFTLLTFLGYAGEKKGKKTRYVYAGAQLVIIILGMILYIGLYPSEGAVEKFIAKALNESLHLYGRENVTTDGKGSVDNAWDKVQSKFGCCGIQNYLAWESANLEPPVPVSCCREDHRMERCSDDVRFNNPYEASKVIYVQGCLEPIRADTMGQVKFLDYFLIPIMVVTCIGFIVTCCSSGVKKDDENVEVKKVGPIVLRRKTLKKKGDVESPDDADAGTQLALTEKGESDGKTAEGAGSVAAETKPATEASVPT